MKPWTKTAVLICLNEKNLGNEGVPCGYGNVDGRRPSLPTPIDDDVTIMGGSMGEAGRIKIMNFAEKAIEAGYPLNFNDAAGCDKRSGIGPSHAY